MRFYVRVPRGYQVSLGGGGELQTSRVLAVGVAGFRAASNHRFSGDALPLRVQVPNNHMLPGTNLQKYYP